MYKAELTLQAEEDLSRIDKVIAKRIVDKIEWPCQNIEHVFREPLAGKFRGKYKLRVGDWRIIYSIEHLNNHIITSSNISRKELIRKFRALGYSGPFSGGRHQFPNPHGSGDIHISLVKEILRQAGISGNEWGKA